MGRSILDSSLAMSNILAIAAHRASSPWPPTSRGTRLTDEGRTTNDSAMFPREEEERLGAAPPGGDAPTTPGLPPRASSGRTHDSSTPPPCDEPASPWRPGAVLPSAPSVTSKTAAHAWHLKRSRACAPLGAATGGVGGSIATDTLP